MGAEFSCKFGAWAPFLKRAIADKGGAKIMRTPTYIVGLLLTGFVWADCVNCVRIEQIGDGYYLVARDALGETSHIEALPDDTPDSVAAGFNEQYASNSEPSSVAGGRAFGQLALAMGPSISAAAASMARTVTRIERHETPTEIIIIVIVEVYDEDDNLISAKSFEHRIKKPNTEAPKDGQKSGQGSG